MTRSRKILISLLLGLGVFLASAGIYGAITWQRLKQDGGIERLLEQALTKPAIGIEARVEQAELEFQLSATPLFLRARNISLNAEDTSIVLPRSEFRFSWQNLILGRLIPSSMQINELEMEISHGSAGWHTGPTMTMLAALLSQDQPEAANTATLSGIRQIRINGARLKIGRKVNDQVTRVEDADIPEHTIIAPIDIQLRLDGRRLLGHVELRQLAGGRMIMDFSGNATGSVIDIGLAFSSVNLRDIYPYLGVDLPQLADAGRLDGQLALTLRNRQIARVASEFTAKQGQMELPGLGLASYDELAAILSFDAEQDLLVIDRLDMSRQYGEGEASRQVSVTGQIRDLSTEKPIVVAKVKGSNIAFQDAFGLWPAQVEPQLRELVSKNLNGGSITSFGVESVGVLEKSTRRYNATTLDVIADLEDMDLDTGFASIERLKGKLRSRLELSIANSGVIEHASADFLLLEASLKPEGDHKAAELEGIELRTRLVGDKLQITRAAIDARHLGQLALAAQIELQDNWHPHRLDVTVKAEQIDKDFMTALWPEEIQPKTRAWVGERVQGGVVNGLAVNAGFDLPEEGGASVLYINGKAEISRSALVFLRTMPPLRNTSAAVSFEGSSLRFDLLSGTVEGLDMAGSRFIIRATDAGPQGDLALLGTGDFSGALKLLDHPRLNLLRPRGLALSQSEGQVDLTMSMKWLIPTSGETLKEMGGAEINATASVAGAGLHGLPYGIVLKDGGLNIVYSGRKLEISGRGRFNDAPGVVSLTRQPGGALKMDLVLQPSNELTNWLQQKFGMGLQGKTGAAIKMDDQDGMEELVLETRFDLDQTSINIERFGLTKLPGEKAGMRARFLISENNINAISDIEVESDILAAKGRINFDESGQFLGAIFDHIAWPGNDISNMTLERNAEDIMRVTADARIIDLTPLRREESPGKGMSLIVDLTADRIVIDERVSFSGNVALATRADGVGSATLLGNLFLKGNPMLTEGTLKATFGAGNDQLEGRGLIGGAEASLVLGPGEHGGELLALKSDNAGQVLKTLEVTDAIRSGKLDMKVIYQPDKDGHYDVVMDLENFSVIEAPRAVRMLSVLSLAGLYSLLEGDGTNFRQGSAFIEVTPEKQIIHQARGAGEALAVDFVGVVDKTSREVEVSGALLPVYGITKLIGKVPLLGEILTGLDNAGLFVTQFSISGPIDDPQSRVNASSIIPGVFRDVFSPDWVNRERARLIGAEEEPAPASGSETLTPR